MGMKLMMKIKNSNICIELLQLESRSEKIQWEHQYGNKNFLINVQLGKMKLKKNEEFELRFKSIPEQVKNAKDAEELKAKIDKERAEWEQKMYAEEQVWEEQMR